MAKKREHLKKLVRHISHNYTPAKAEKIPYKIPLGLKIIMVYLAVLCSFYLAYMVVGIKAPIVVVLGKMVQGNAIFFLLLALFTASASLIYGLWRRRRWAYYLGIVWFAFGILNSILSLIYVKTDLFQATKHFMILTSIFVIVINGLTIWYFKAEKDYFFKHALLYRKPGLTDKIFACLTIIFLLGTLIVGGFIGYDFFKSNLKITQKIVDEIGNASAVDQVIYCNTKDGSERDLCYLVISIKQESTTLCGYINSEFFRLTCLQA